jgi:hypothetical protein
LKGNQRASHYAVYGNDSDFHRPNVSLWMSLAPHLIRDPGLPSEDTARRGGVPCGATVRCREQAVTGRMSIEGSGTGKPVSGKGAEGDFHK